MRTTRLCRRGKGAAKRGLGARRSGLVLFAGKALALLLSVWRHQTPVRPMWDLPNGFAESARTRGPMWKGVGGSCRARREEKRREDLQNGNRPDCTGLAEGLKDQNCVSGG